MTREIWSICFPGGFLLLLQIVNGSMFHGIRELMSIKLNYQILFRSLITHRQNTWLWLARVYLCPVSLSEYHCIYAWPPSRVLMLLIWNSYTVWLFPAIGLFPFFLHFKSTDPYACLYTIAFFSPWEIVLQVEFLDQNVWIILPWLLSTALALYKYLGSLNCHPTLSLSSQHGQHKIMLF